jgi:hypothetical protein
MTLSKADLWSLFIGPSSGLLHAATRAVVRSFKKDIRSSLHKPSCFRTFQFSQATEAKNRSDSTRASLQTLPPEIQWKIFGLLDYPSALFPTATCNSIRSARRTPLMFQKSGARVAFIHAAEKFPQHNRGGEFALFPWGAGYQRPREEEVEWPPTCYMCKTRDKNQRF